MGLDMYLYKHILIGAQYDHRNVKGSIEVTIGDQPVPINFERVAYIIEAAGYWRKANAIHRWFVEYVQGGEDHCKEYYVSQSNLQELLDAVNTVLNSIELVDGKVCSGYTIQNGVRVENLENGRVVKDPSIAVALLPTQEGFFFGSTDYDEWYVDDLKHTKEILERALAEAYPGVSYYYTSSW